MNNQQRTHTSGSQRSEASDKKIQLPKIKKTIGEKQIMQIDGQLEDNPFYVPEDYEILKMKEEEKLNRLKERAQNQKLKIWEKGIKSKGKYTVSSINEQYKIDEEAEDEYAKLNIVDAAKNAMKNRVRQKEPMHQFIDKKREMLLFQMLIDHKKNQINEFEELTRLHKKGLEKSEQMLEEDIEAFNKFLEENKNNSRQAIKAAEDETKKKQEKQFEIKQLNELRSDLQTKISQKAENLDEFWGYKKFLDRITPKEFIEVLERKRKNKKDNTKKKTSDSTSYKKLVDTYNITIHQDILDILDDSDEEFEPYFKKPEQLEQIFIDLQEKNLSLIQNTQEREQQAEEIKHIFLQKQKMLNEEKQNIIKAKNDLLKNLDNVNEQIKHLKQVKNDNQTPSQLLQINQEILKIYKNDPISQEKGVDIRKDIMGIEIIKEMELKLESLLDQLKQERAKNEQRLQNAEKQSTQERRDEIKKSKQEQENKNMQLRQQVLAQPKKEKRYGRPIMERMLPQKKIIEEKQEEEESEQERDYRKYLPDNY
ncbi:hypothetical protein ABPG74_016705 [Tetrahymena malaccensis]